MSRDRFTADEARHLTSVERMSLIAKGALIFDGSKQSDVLCGLISALTKDEIGEATRILGEAQDLGNFCAQEVWDSLWTQWGRVDPEGCLAGFAERPDGKSRADARHVMKGWLEEDPQAALAWAKQPKFTFPEAAAASLAITSSAGGDLERLESAMRELPAGSIVAKECLRDYFDLAGLSGDSVPASQIYDRLDPSLRETAWSIAMERLSYSDPQAAAEWLTEHAQDPGRNYASTYRLVHHLAGQDPSGTVQWAARLPVAGAGSPDGANQHPATLAFSRWLHENGAVAMQWLQSQPADAPWVVRFRGDHDGAR